MICLVISHSHWQRVFLQYVLWCAVGQYWLVYSILLQCINYTNQMLICINTETIPVVCIVYIDNSGLDQIIESEVALVTRLHYQVEISCVWVIYQSCMVLVSVLPNYENLHM